VLPYRRRAKGQFEVALFKRADEGWWQFIAGGGEADETPLQAAQREAHEEAGISLTSQFIRLQSQCTVPVVGVTGGFTWGEDVYVIPEYCFAVEVDEEIVLSHEHSDCRWASYAETGPLLRWDSNRNALWELRERLQRPLISQLAPSNVVSLNEASA
jgi:dATP pyrophosphohydrolase